MTLLAQRNNLSASFIQAGQLTEAYRELRGVLNEVTLRLKEPGFFDATSTSSADDFDLQPLFTPSPQVESCFFDAPLLLRGRQGAEATVEGASYVCATALFNMGLVCQYIAAQEHRSPAEKHRWRGQARNFYGQAYQISRKVFSPLLSTALCNNLMELSFEEADADTVRFWKSEFETCLGSISMDTPSDVWVHFSIVQVYFLPSMHCAGAA